MEGDEAAAAPAAAPCADGPAAPPPARSSGRKRPYAALDENDDDVQVVRRWSIPDDGNDEGDDDVEITKVVSKKKHLNKARYTAAVRPTLENTIDDRLQNGHKVTTEKKKKQTQKENEKKQKEQKKERQEEKRRWKEVTKARPKTTPEKRLRKFRTHSPMRYDEVKERAMVQRLFVVDRRRCGSEECPEEELDIVGSTGNIYKVTINKVPECSCPEGMRGKQCKHIVFVLTRVLHAPEHLEYQLAFVTSELREIFANAPPIPSADADAAENDGKRKPIEGDCPICCKDYELEEEKIVYCKAACGNNIHQECFDQWAASKKGGAVTCPFCRQPWQEDEVDIKSIAKTATVGPEGYFNVASQLGISSERDYSTYHDVWVRRQARDGRIDIRWANYHRT